MSNVFKKIILFGQAFFNVKINGICILLGQSRTEGLTLFRDVNQEGVDVDFVMVAQRNCQVEGFYNVFTYIRLRDITEFIRNQ